MIQVTKCLDHHQCFMFRNWFYPSAPNQRRIQTLLDCFITLGFTNQDKQTFLHRAFTVPKLKKAAHNVVEWANVNQFAEDNYNMPQLDQFT